MEIDTRHGIHITEKAGSYHMSSENWQINQKTCQTLRSQSPRRVSLYLELISDERGDRTSIIVTVALCAKHYSTRAEIFDKLKEHQCYHIFLKKHWGESDNSYYLICSVLLFSKNGRLVTVQTKNVFRRNE